MFVGLDKLFGHCLGNQVFGFLPRQLGAMESSWQMDERVEKRRASAGSAASLAVGITWGDVSLGGCQTFPGTAPGGVSLSVLGAFISKKE